MKITFFVGLIVYILPIITLAQSNKILKVEEIPNHIKIYIFENYTYKTEMTNETQVWLANELVAKDNLELTLINKNANNLNQIINFKDSINWKIEERLIAVMNKNERMNFEAKLLSTRYLPVPIHNGKLYPNAEMNSQFGIAIKLKEQLKLNSKQVDSLLVFAEILKSNFTKSNDDPLSGYFNSKAFESKFLNKILTQDQYRKVLAIKNYNNCEKKAKYTWNEMSKYPWINKFTIDTSLKKLTIYFLTKTHIIDCFAHESYKIPSLIKLIKEPEEIILLKKAKTNNIDKIENYAW
jgi:hypothetical protein